MGDGRICTGCDVWKPWGEFHRNKDGFNGYCSQCKECRSATRKEWRKHKNEHRARLDALYKERDELLEQGLKRCSKCKQIKHTDCFGADTRKPDGLQSQCRDCYCEERRTPQYKEKLWLRKNGLKRCARCKKVKPLSEFYKNPHMTDGRQSHCKTCWREKRSPSAIERERLFKRGLKRCIECHQIKQLGAFNRFHNSFDGRASYCRKCSKRLNRKWSQENPMRVRIQSATRRARKRMAKGTFDEKDVERIYDEQGGACIYHGIDPECRGDLSNGFEVDHIIPLSRTELNPSNGPENIQLLCRHCNQAKWSRTHDEFLEWLKQMN